MAFTGVWSTHSTPIWSVHSALVWMLSQQDGIGIRVVLKNADNMDTTNYGCDTNN